MFITFKIYDATSESFDWSDQSEKSIDLRAKAGLACSMHLRMLWCVTFSLVDLLTHQGNQFHAHPSHFTASQQVIKSKNASPL
jgi:hypothetical protein